jgi:hypothetical protein
VAEAAGRGAASSSAHDWQAALKLTAASTLSAVTLPILVDDQGLVTMLRSNSGSWESM